VIGAYHSHPSSAAEPSARDIDEAHYPEFIHVIVSLADPDAPRVGAYRIIRGSVSVVALEPEGEGT
jgi:[CysO sulfur-carrier protein]-S-L-cysteine hydrolase